MSTAGADKAVIAGSGSIAKLGAARSMLRVRVAGTDTLPAKSVTVADITVVSARDASVAGVKVNDQLPDSATVVNKSPAISKVTGLPSATSVLPFKASGNRVSATPITSSSSITANVNEGAIRSTSTSSTEVSTLIFPAASETRATTSWMPCDNGAVASMATDQNPNSSTVIGAVSRVPYVVPSISTVNRSPKPMTAVPLRTGVMVLVSSDVTVGTVGAMVSTVNSSTVVSIEEFPATSVAVTVRS